MIELSVGEVSEDVLVNFQIDENGCYYNRKLEGVIEKREDYSKSRSENGSKGGRPRKETTEKPYENHMVIENETIEKPYAKAYENHSENENENINEIVNDIYNYWNSKNIIKHRELKSDMEKAIKSALKIYSADEIKTYIDRYSQLLSDEQYFFTYEWSLKDFLTRKDGISSFTDEGSKWVSYCSYKGKKRGEEKKSEDDPFASLMKRIEMGEDLNDSK
ncbi:MAG: hypothetical protein IKU25_09360 [Clostridia bacterium]|nr:hypothetical protein [Clostridia bacterium]